MTRFHLHFFYAVANFNFLQHKTLREDVYAASRKSAALRRAKAKPFMSKGRRALRYVSSLCYVCIGNCETSPQS